MAHHGLLDRLRSRLSLILLGRGDRVVVTARDTQKSTTLSRATQNELPLELDVDEQAQIDAAVKAAKETFGRIDVLVNNAGYGYLAAIEEGDDDEIRAMFETNVFGLAAMTRAVLPMMRAQSRARSSTSRRWAASSFPRARAITPRPSSRSKACRKRCRKEVAPLGIKVIVVEPGPFRTDWAGRSLKMPKRPIDAYAETAIARRHKSRAIAASQAGDPVRAAKRSSRPSKRRIRR